MASPLNHTFPEIDQIDDKPPPRKQLRLLVKGCEKVNELLRRRHRKKDQHSSNRPNGRADSDVEDEVPIFSRIADPALATKPALRIKLIVTDPESREDTPTTPTLKRPLSSETDTSDDQDVVAGKTQVDERVIKSQRRKGIVGIEGLKERPQTTFTAGAVVAQRLLIATQPSSTEVNSKFTFQSSTYIASGVSSTPSLRPLSSRPAATLPQLQQVARNAFLKPSLEADEKGQGALDQKQNVKLHYQNTKTEDTSNSTGPGSKSTTPSNVTPTAVPEQAYQESQSQLIPVPRLFDNCKLGSRDTILPPRIDYATSIDNISSFVRPQVPIPEFSPAVYRSLYHKPGYTRDLMERSLPDGIESQQFAEDVELGLLPARRNKNGDVPALVHDPHTERVPIGARYGGSKMMLPINALPGRPVMQPRSSQVGAQPQPPSEIPDNLYTEPNRLSKAYLASSRKDLKRKRRTNAALPPPSYIHQHTASSSFNIFTNGILLYPELCLLLAPHLPVQTLINLYSISKDYHVILNQRFTTVILNQATIKAPAAAQCYPWRSYAHLCQPDPAHISATTSLTKDLTSSTLGSVINIQPPPPATHESTAPPGFFAAYSIKNPHNYLPPSKRKVPTFRWLHMALHREKTIHEIYYLFAARGVPLPGDPTDTSRNSFCLTLHKLWFSFDLPDNIRRMAYFKSPLLITPSDLANILTFTVKLDMICNDPLAGEKRDAMRKLIMSSVNGLDTLHRVLKNELWTDELEVLRAWTRYGFQLDREDANERPTGGGWVPLGLSEEDHAASDFVFGIPRDEVGLLKKEFWGTLDYNATERRRTLPAVGRKTQYLMRPDQIVLRESIRRGMKMGKQYLTALLTGYVDAETLTAVPPRDLNGGRSRVLEEHDEYGVDDLVGGVRALRVEDGGDPLLDVGDPWEGSPLTVRHVGARRQQVEKMEGEKGRLKGYMDAWRGEVQVEEEERRGYGGFTYLEG